MEGEREGGEEEGKEAKGGREGVDYTLMRISLAFSCASWRIKLTICRIWAPEEPPSLPILPCLRCEGWVGRQV